MPAWENISAFCLTVELRTVHFTVALIRPCYKFTSLNLFTLQASLYDRHFTLCSTEVRTRLWSLLKVITHVGNSKTDITSQHLVAETMSSSLGCLPGMAIIWTIISMGYGPSTLGLWPLFHSLSLSLSMGHGTEIQHIASLLPNREHDSSLASAFFTWKTGFCMMQSSLSSNELITEFPLCPPTWQGSHTAFPAWSKTPIVSSVHLVLDRPRGCLWFSDPESHLVNLSSPFNI